MPRTVHRRVACHLITRATIWQQQRRAELANDHQLTICQRTVTPVAQAPRLPIGEERRRRLMSLYMPVPFGGGTTVLSCVRGTLAYVAFRHSPKSPPVQRGSAGRPQGGNHDPSHGDRPGRHHTAPPAVRRGGPSRPEAERPPMERGPSASAEWTVTPRRRARSRCGGSSPRSTHPRARRGASRTSSTRRRSCSARTPPGCG